MIKILQVGLGPIGLQTVKYLTGREGVKLVGGVDIDPQKAGKTIWDIANFEAPRVQIYESVASASKQVKADVALLTTVSQLSRIESQIAAIAEQQLHIVSTCEELTYPWNTQPDIARRIDNHCKEHAISCLSTGVNPGFLMDYLPSVFTAVCQHVDHVYVARIQDAAPRRGPFQQKIGVGLSIEEFEENRARLSHVGLPESVWMIAGSLGWALDRVDDTLEPVLAKEMIKTDAHTILAGMNRGVEQVAKGYREGEEVIKLRFKAAVGEAEPRDSVQIQGQPSFMSAIAGGINGDIATAAITINAIRSVQKTSPGLKTMLDIPVPSFFV